MTWKMFSELQPEISGTYDVCISREGYPPYVETAEYSKSRNAFLWYSKRGYLYEIKVSHWKELPPLPEILTSGEI